MDQIIKPVPNSHIGRYLFVVYWHLYCFVFFCAQSFTSDKTNDRDTSYFYVSKQNAICDLSLFWCLGKADFSLCWRLCLVLDNFLNIGWVYYRYDWLICGSTRFYVIFNDFQSY